MNTDNPTGCKLAPIAIFAFNRPDSLTRLLDSLSKNKLYAESPKYIFIDGPRDERDTPQVEHVAKIAGQHGLNIVRSSRNLGLARNIIGGISRILELYDRVIVVEDDLYCAPSFLLYMNQALEFYKQAPAILSICGYGLKIKRPGNYSGDVYLSNRSSSWGWGTWADRWAEIDWDIPDWQQLKKKPGIKSGFNRGGSDMYGMLDDYKKGRNNSWAIRFCFHQFRYGLYSVHPFLSLVANEGYGTSATNCRQKYSRFKVDMNLSEDISFNLTDNISPDNRILRRLRSYHSIPIRIYSRLRRLLNI